MATSGTLSEIGFVSLLQFPNSTRKSGLLTVRTADGKAEFFYDKGELVHAVFGQSTGRDVLIDLIDLKDGQFSFQAGVEPAEITITDNLHQVIMWALKERDERRNLQENKPEHNSEQLDDLLKSEAEIKCICIFSDTGQMIVSSTLQNDCMLKVESYRKSITSFIAESPGRLKGKAFIVTADISIAISGLDEDRSVVISSGTDSGLTELNAVLSRITGGL